MLVMLMESKFVVDKSFKYFLKLLFFSNRVNRAVTRDTYPSNIAVPQGSSLIFKNVAIVLELLTGECAGPLHHYLVCPPVFSILAPPALPPEWSLLT